MRRRHVPMAQRRGRILVLPEPNDFRHFFLEIGPIYRLLHRAVLRDRPGRVVNRIAAENEELLDAAGVNFARQLKNAVRPRSVRKFADEQRRADVFQRGVDPVNHQLHHDRLVRSGDDEAGARFQEQVLRGLLEPAFVVLLGIVRRFQRKQYRRETRVLRCDRDFGRQRMRDGRDLAGGVTQTMIRHRAGEGEAILDDVKTVHRVLRFAHATARSEAANRSEIAFPAVQEIAVEREDNIGFIELRDQAHVVAETDLRGKTLRLAQQRIVDAPAHFWELLLKFRPQPLARRRKSFLDEKCEASAGVGRELRPQIGNVFFKCCAIGNLVLLNKSFCAGWVVKIEHRCLRESIRGAATVGMKRIAFDLDRTPVDRGDHQRDRAGPTRHRGRVIERLARNCPFNAFRERNEMHLRFAATVQTEARQRHGRAHQFQKASPRNFIALQLRRARWKFALEPAAEFRRIGELVQTAPVAFPGQRFGGMFEDAFHR